MPSTKTLLPAFLLLLCNIAIAQTTMVPFTASNGAFKLWVPENWKQEKSKQSLLKLVDDTNDKRRIEMDRFDFQFVDSYPIEELSKDQLANYKDGVNENGDKLLSGNFRNLAGRKWWVIDYDSKGTHYRAYQLRYKKSKYSFYYYAPMADFASGEALAEAAVSSLRFKEDADFNTLPMPVVAAPVKPAELKKEGPASAKPARNVDSASLVKAAAPVSNDRVDVAPAPPVVKVDASPATVEAVRKWLIAAIPKTPGEGQDLLNKKLHTARFIAYYTEGWEVNGEFEEGNEAAGKKLEAAYNKKWKGQYDMAHNNSLGNNFPVCAQDWDKITATATFLKAAKDGLWFKCQIKSGLPGDKGCRKDIKVVTVNGKYFIDDVMYY